MTEKEERIKQLAVPENFAVKITPRLEMWSSLSSREQARLSNKLELVTRAAQRLAANMVKGVLKYESDEYSVEKWIAHLQDDAGDALNYSYLLEEQYLKEGHDVINLIGDEETRRLEDEDMKLKGL